MNNSWLPELFNHFLQSGSVSIDSRTLEEGDIFFALRGDRFDGHDYIDRAIEKGAVLIVIDRPERETKNTFLVPDTLVALQRLSSYYRDRLDIPVFALTGSNGKTTTKNLIKEVLSTKYKVHVTSGNYNNHIGLPLTILSCPSDAEILVLEMGANHVGEISFLCNIGKPDLGLITNVGFAHLEGFGSFEGVKQGKGELYEHIKEKGGVLFLNRSEDHLSEMAGDYSPCVRYDSQHIQLLDEQILDIDEVSFDSGISFKICGEGGQTEWVHSSLFGLHNLQNVLTAVAVGSHFSVSLTQISEGIAGFTASGNRSERINVGKNEFILDAYNANPSSIRISLESFDKLSGEPKIAILGDMLELGDRSIELHEEILAFALSKRIDQIITVGPIFSGISEKTGEVQSFESVDVLREWWNEQHFKDALIFMKGSRGIGLEKMIQPKR